MLSNGILAKKPKYGTINYKILKGRNENERKYTPDL